MKRHQKLVKLCDHRHYMTHRACSTQHCHRLSWQHSSAPSNEVEAPLGGITWPGKHISFYFFVKYMFLKTKKVCSLKFIECNLITYTSIHSISLIWFTTYELVIRSNEIWLMCIKHTSFPPKVKSTSCMRGGRRHWRRASLQLWWLTNRTTKTPQNRFQKIKSQK